jgi:tyrosinase
VEKDLINLFSLQMTDLFNSANDPLFWMHHTGMDRIWSLWQEQDPKRVHDGDTRRGIFDVSPMTLESPLWMGVFAPDRRVGDLFDTLNRDGKGFLCYKYEGMPIEKYTT